MSEPQAGDKSLVAALLRSSSAAAEKEALVCVDGGRSERRTYRELQADVSRAAGALRARGVADGSHVALVLGNGMEWIEAFFGCLALGAVVIPVSTRLRVDELRYMLHQSRTEYVITETDFCGLRLFEQVNQALAGTRDTTEKCCVEQVLVSGSFEPGRDTPASVARWHDLLAQSDPDSVDLLGIASDVDPGALAILKYTSGSTGFPKGVMLQHDGLVRNALDHAARLGVTPADRWLSGKPFYHASGSIWGLLTMLLSQGTLVFERWYSPDENLRLIEEERCTVNFAGSTILRDQLYHPSLSEVDRSSVRLVEVLDLSLMADAVAAFPQAKMFCPYGITEAYGVLSVCAPDDPPEKQTSTHGRPLPGIEIMVGEGPAELGTAGHVLGELLVRGTHSIGYWDKPRESADLIDAAGWIHTGDLGFIDEDGYVHYEGRSKAMIKTGGENVSLEEVERVIKEFEDVTDCVVVGIADERLDQVGYAIVEPKPGKRIDLRELEQWCAARMAKYKLPRVFSARSELPRTPSGKIDRFSAGKLASKGDDS